MPLSRIQRGQIQEVLNYDLNMYARVVDLEKQRVARFQEDTPGEYVQLGDELLHLLHHVLVHCVYSLGASSWNLATRCYSKPTALACMFRS